MGRLEIHSPSQLVFRYAELHLSRSSVPARDPCARLELVPAKECERPGCESRGWDYFPISRRDSGRNNGFIWRCIRCNAIWTQRVIPSPAVQSSIRVDITGEILSELGTLSTLVLRRPEGAGFAGINEKTWLWHRLCFGLFLEGAGYDGLARLGAELWREGRNPPFPNLEELPVLCTLLGDLKKWPGRRDRRFTAHHVRDSIKGPRRQRGAQSNEWPGIERVYRERIGAAGLSQGE